jgi:hypothetical protein
MTSPTRWFLPLAFLLPACSTPDTAWNGPAIPFTEWHLSNDAALKGILRECGAGPVSANVKVVLLFRPTEGKGQRPLNLEDVTVKGADFDLAFHDCVIARAPALLGTPTGELVSILTVPIDPMP